MNYARLQRERDSEREREREQASDTNEKYTDRKGNVHTDNRIYTLLPVATWD